VRNFELRWDIAKAKSNLDKHGVSFEEAADTLNDILASVRSDQYHSVEEDRFVIIGESAAGKLLTVVFAIEGNAARIISARRPTAAERRRYMKEDDVLRDSPMDDEMLDDYGHLEGWMKNPFRFTRVGQVRLDPDVQEHFRTAEEVNAALRSLIAEGRVPEATRK